MEAARWFCNIVQYFAARWHNVLLTGTLPSNLIWFNISPLDGTRESLGDLILNIITCVPLPLDVDWLSRLSLDSLWRSRALLLRELRDQLLPP